jgi:Effector Associated Constant Component 1
MAGERFDGVTVQVLPFADGDLEELTALTARLRDELLELDVAGVDDVPAPDVPGDAKGVGAVTGWLVVQLGAAGGARALLEIVRQWVTRTRHEVEVTWGGDSLKVSGVSSAQQEKIIDAWLARHSADD